MPGSESVRTNNAIERTHPSSEAAPLVSGVGPIGKIGKMLKSYRASCHCGRIVIEAELDLAQASFRCNCSICRRNRFWPAIATADHFRIIAGEGELTRYVFGQERNHHFFCRHCGVRVFGVGNDTPIGKMYGVNIGCLEGVTEEELSRIPITFIDGMHDRWSSAPEFVQHL